MWMLIMTILNEQTLLMLTIVPGKALIWFITVFSGVWVSSLCKRVTVALIFFIRYFVEECSKNNTSFIQKKL